MRTLSIALVSALALSAVSLSAQATTTPAPAAATPAASDTADAPAASPPAATPAPTTATATATAATPNAAPPGVNLTQPVLPPDIGKLVDTSEVPALQNIVKPGTQLRFIGDEHGLKAYFATNGNRGQVVYVTPDGQASFIGAMFTADGVSMSMLQLTRLRIAGFDPLPYLNNSSSGAPSFTPPPAIAQTAPATTAAMPVATQAQGSLGEQLLADATKASWIAYGSPTAVPLTIFMDPNCSHCHTFFKQLLPLAQQNKIYLRIVPVSVVDPQKSGPDVINILSSTNPQEIWTNKVNGQTVPTAATPNPQAAAALRVNNSTFSRWQLPGTPYSVYKDRSGTVKVLFSEPTNIDDFLKEIGAN